MAATWRAFLLRDWRIARSYRFPFALGFVWTLLSISVYFFLSDIVRTDTLPAGEGRSQGYFAFALVGVVALDILGVALVAVGRAIRDEQTAGTLEVLLTTPARTWLVALGMATYQTLYGLVAGAISLLLGVLVFHVHFDLGLSSAVALVAATVAMLILVGALGVAVAALTVIVKQTTTIAAILITALAMLSGAYFPVDVLPEPLHAIAMVSPFRWSLDVLRPALFGGDIPVGELLALVAVTVVIVPLAFGVFYAALRRARRTGSLGHY